MKIIPILFLISLGACGTGSAYAPPPAYPYLSVPVVPPNPPMMVGSARRGPGIPPMALASNYLRLKNDVLVRAFGGRWTPGVITKVWIGPTPVNIAMLKQQGKPVFGRPAVAMYDGVAQMPYLMYGEEILIPLPPCAQLDGAINEDGMPACEVRVTYQVANPFLDPLGQVLPNPAAPSACRVKDVNVRLGVAIADRNDRPLGQSCPGASPIASR